MKRPHRHKAKRRWRGSKQPPGVRNLLAWLLPCVVFSGLADWMVAAQMLQHYQRYGHVCFPGAGLAFALSITGTTIAIPFLWLQARRQAR